MVAVNTVDAMKYGFRLLGYLIAVFIAGGILWLIGVGFAPSGFRQGNPILAGVFFLAGAAVIYAGGLGIFYKVIADGVEIGNRAAERDPHQPVPGQQAGQPQDPTQ